LLYHARISADRDQRRQLLSAASDLIRDGEATPSSGGLYNNHTASLLPDLPLIRDIDPDTLDLLIFNTLWMLPEQFEGELLQFILGDAAQIVALRDRDLARTLIEPAFEDRGWLFMGHYVRFDRNDALNSLAGIDPQWSVEIVDLLCREELRHNPVDQLELRCGMVTDLMSRD
jgi:hypothetical protein